LEGTSSIAIEGDNAYFSTLWNAPAAPRFSFSAFDISDPKNPEMVVTLLDNQDQLGGLDMALQGNYAYPA